MSELLENSQNVSNNLLPIREAAKRVSYTTDYVGRLAREGKILAKREGRVWLVDLDSLKLFSLQAKADAIRKHEELKVTRKLESVARQANSFLPEKKVTDQSFYQVALLESAAVTVCLSLLFLLVQVSLSFGLGLTDFQKASLTVGAKTSQALAIQTSIDFVWPDWLWFWRYEKSEVLVEIQSDNTEDPQNPEPQVGKVKTNFPAQVDIENNLLLIPQSGLVEDQVKYVADTFSDEVLVDFYDSRQGTITVDFLSGEKEEYPFRLLTEPVNPSKD
jgi:hypothetical protein